MNVIHKNSLFNICGGQYKLSSEITKRIQKEYMERRVHGFNKQYSQSSDFRKRVCGEQSYNECFTQQIMMTKFPV